MNLQYDDLLGGVDVEKFKKKFSGNYKSLEKKEAKKKPAKKS